MMGLKEEYEARKSGEKARQEKQKESSEEHAKISAAARASFFRHPDRVVRYSGHLALYTFALTVATAVLVGATIYNAIVLKSTDKKIGRQLDLMETDQRPWIKLNIVEPLEMVISDTIRFGIVLKPFNTGKTPARNVDFWVESLGPESDDILKNHDRTCKLAEWSSSQKKNDLTILPNDPDVGTQGFSFSDSAAKYRFLVGGPFNPASEYYLMPIIIGCVAYKSTLSDKFHHTWFSYRFVGASEWIKASDLTQPPPRTIEKTKVQIRLGQPWGRNTAD